MESCTLRANGNCSWRCLNGRETLRSCVRSFPRPPWVLGRRPSLTATSRRAGLWRPPAARATSANQNRLSSPYLTLHWSWMLNDFAFGQLASTCRSSGNFMSPYFSISLATLYRPAPTAELAFDREGRHAKVRQGVGVLSHQDSCRSGGELGRTLRRDFLRLRRRNHLGARRDHDVGTWLRQVRSLVGLRLFYRRRRVDHIWLGDWYRLVGLHRSVLLGGPSGG